MTHKPPVPDEQTPPWPATPAPQEHHPATTPGQDEDGGWAISRNAVAVAAGVAVGSAAVAAALLFAGRLSKPKTAAVTPPPPNTPRRQSGAAGIQVGDSD